MVLFVPVVKVEDDHLSRGDGDSLVGVSVDDVNVFVVVGRQNHGELPAVLGEDGLLLQNHPSVGLGHDEGIAAFGLSHVADRDDRVVLVSVKNHTSE